MPTGIYSMPGLCFLCSLEGMHSWRKSVQKATEKDILSKPQHFESVFAISLLSVGYGLPCALVFTVDDQSICMTFASITADFG